MLWIGVWDKQVTGGELGRVPVALSARRPVYEHDGPRYRIAVYQGMGRAREARNGAGVEFVAGTWNSERSSQPTAAVRVRVDVEAERLEVAVPLTALDQVCHTNGKGRFALSNDPRLLYEPGMEVDQRALYLLLQFGAATPPFGPWKETKRLAPGMRHEVRFADMQPREAGLVSQPVVLGPSGGVTAIEREKTLDRVVAALDSTLVAAVTDDAPQLLFSGGVDSGLLASRLAALGWRNARLMHLSFGAGDPETDIATRMARHLGLRIEVVRDDVEPLELLLENVGREYCVPFGDHSAIPTHAIVRRILEGHAGEGVVINGVGADGDFGLYDKAEKWNRVYRFPEFMRRILGGLYVPLGVWRRRWRLEVMLRLMRRSVQMPGPLASIAQNPMLGVLYRFDRAVVDEALAEFEAWLRRVLPGMDEAGRMCAADVMVTCCGMFAQKDRSLYQAVGRQVVFPFLEPPVFDLAMGEARRVFSLMASKSALKQALARSVPSDLVYRTKSGFAASMQQKFMHPMLVAAMQEVVSGAGVVGPHVIAKRLGVVARDLRQGRRTHAQMHNLTWTMVFAHLWYRQVEALATRA